MADNQFANNIEEAVSEAIEYNNAVVESEKAKANRLENLLTNNSFRIVGSGEFKTDGYDIMVAFTDNKAKERFSIEDEILTANVIYNPVHNTIMLNIVLETGEMLTFDTKYFEPEEVEAFANEINQTYQYINIKTDAEKNITKAYNDFLNGNNIPENTTNNKRITADSLRGIIDLRLETIEDGVKKYSFEEKNLLHKYAELLFEDGDHFTTDGRTEEWDAWNDMAVKVAEEQYGLKNGYLLYALPELEQVVNYIENERTHKAEIEAQAVADTIKETVNVPTLEPVNGRYFIDCPIEEKNEAKALGARWDSSQKKWYFENANDAPKFAKWIRNEVQKNQSENLPDIKSENGKYYINCPINEKEEAKRLGARWDRNKSSWYFTESGDIHKFVKWINNNETVAPATSKKNTLDGAENDVNVLIDNIKSDLADMTSIDTYKKFLDKLAIMPEKTVRDILIINRYRPTATYLSTYLEYQDNGRKLVKDQKSCAYLVKPNIYSKTTDTAVKEIDRNINRNGESRIGRYVFTKTNSGNYNIEFGYGERTPVIKNADKKSLRGLLSSKIIGKEYGYPPYLSKAVFDISQTEPMYVEDGVLHPAYKVNMSESTGKIVEGTVIEMASLYESIARAFTGELPEIVGTQTPIQAITNLVRSYSETKFADADNSTKRVQAEATAYIVCKHYNIDADITLHTFAEQGQNVNEIESILRNIRFEANKIINTVNEQVLLLEKQDLSKEARFLNNDVFKEILSQEPEEITTETVEEIVEEKLEEIVEEVVDESLEMVENENTSKFKYYVVNRPVSMGTVPNGFTDFTNFDERTYVEDARREVWGEVEYDKPLTDREIADYELIADRTVKLSLEQRVSQDELLNVQDLIEEIKSVGGEVDEYGNVTVYHRTNENNAQRISQTGIMVAKEDGLFFSTKVTGYNEGYGNTVIKMLIPAEKLLLDDVFQDEAHLRYPLNNERRLNISDYIIEIIEDSQEIVNEETGNDLEDKDIVGEETPINGDEQVELENDLQSNDEDMYEQPLQVDVEEMFISFTVAGEIKPTDIDMGEIDVHLSNNRTITGSIESLSTEAVDGQTDISLTIGDISSGLSQDELKNPQFKVEGITGMVLDRNSNRNLLYGMNLHSIILTAGDDEYEFDDIINGQQVHDNEPEIEEAIVDEPLEASNLTMRYFVSNIYKEDMVGAGLKNVYDEADSIEEALKIYNADISSGTYLGIVVFDGDDKERITYPIEKYSEVIKRYANNPIVAKGIREIDDFYYKQEQTPKMYRNKKEIDYISETKCIQAENVTMEIYQIKDSKIREYGYKSYDMLVNIEKKSIDRRNYNLVAKTTLKKVKDINNLPSVIYEIGNTTEKLKPFELPEQNVRNVAVGDIIKLKIGEDKEIIKYVDNEGFKDLNSFNKMPKKEHLAEIDRFLEEYKADPIVAITGRIGVEKNIAQAMACINAEILPLPKTDEELQSYLKNGSRLAKKIILSSKYATVLINFSENQHLEKGEILSFKEANRKFESLEYAINRLRSEKGDDSYIGYDKTDITIFFKNNSKENPKMFAYNIRVDVGDGNNKNLLEVVQHSMLEKISASEDIIDTGINFGRKLSGEEIIRYQSEMNSVKNCVPLLNKAIKERIIVKDKDEKGNSQKKTEMKKEHQCQDR